MKHIILCLGFIFASSDFTYTSETQKVLKTVETSTVTPNPYNLTLEMSSLDNTLYDLDISMELFDDAHFVSPNSKGDYTGVFSIFIYDNTKLEPVSKLLETPLSVQENDPYTFEKGSVNWVRVNTLYNQKLKRKINDDFIINGHIQFTIEPRCTLEKIPFIISYHKGKMKIEIDKC